MNACGKWMILSKYLLVGFQVTEQNRDEDNKKPNRALILNLLPSIHTLTFKGQICDCGNNPFGYYMNQLL